MRAKITRNSSATLCRFLALSLLFIISACAPKIEEEIIQAPIVEEILPTHIRLVFTGDIMVHGKQLDIARVHGTPENPYNFSPQFEHIKHLLEGDLVIGNFETTLKGSAPYSGYPAFNSPDSLVTALKEANFNVLLLANNHILDYGVDAGLRTIDYIESQGITTTGISESKDNYTLPIIEVSGYKIGFINSTYGSNNPVKSMRKSVYVPTNSKLDIKADVNNLRTRGADFIIASLHWGEEYKPVPNSIQKKLAEECFNAGVDVIVGHHPHILQPMEIIKKNEKNQFVAWSLGNLISAQRTYPRERTVILAVDLIAEPQKELELEKVSVAPLWVDMEYGVRARLLPTQLGELALLQTEQAPENNSTLLQEVKINSKIQKKLYSVHKEILNFLSLPNKESSGFYTVWEKEE